jgi:hypothetical protein
MIEPPTCVPSAIGTISAATAAAEPDDEPPGVRAGSHGFIVGPGWDMPISVVTSLPTITAPPRRSACTDAESSCVMRPFMAGVPISVGMSLVAIRSLTPIGQPSTSDNGRPAL